MHRRDKRQIKLNEKSPGSTDGVRKLCSTNHIPVLTFKVEFDKWVSAKN